MGTFREDDFQNVSFKEQPVDDSFGELSDTDVLFQARENGIRSTTPPFEADGGTSVFFVTGMGLFSHEGQSYKIFRFDLFMEFRKIFITVSVKERKVCKKDGN